MAKVSLKTSILMMGTPLVMGREDGQDLVNKLAKLVREQHSEILELQRLARCSQNSSNNFTEEMTYG